LREHPDVHEPWSTWSEDQTLHIVSVYSNPFRWRTRRELFNTFIRHIRGAANVQLHIVEVAFGSRPFEVTSSSNPDDVQLRTTSEMWHKENAFNEALKRFDWKYAGYVDGDFSLIRHDWALEAIHKLQHSPWVQLYSTYAALSHHHRATRVSSAFAYNYVNKLGAFDRSAPNSTNYGKDVPYPGAPGGGWAWTREAFEATGGLLDTCILGSGDWHMAFGLIGHEDKHAEMKVAAPGYIAAIHDWQRKAFASAKGNIGYVDCFATHGWHGSYKQRGYGSRVEILANYKFDPSIDIVRSCSGLYRWTGNKPGLEMEARRFFVSRNEDDISLDTRPLA
jgi:hypothetical protein